MVTVAAAKAAAGGQRAGEVCRAMAVPLVDRQFKIPQNQQNSTPVQLRAHLNGSLQPILIKIVLK